MLQKRIPTLAAIVVLLLGVVVTSLLVQQGVIVFQQAAPPENPQNLRVTNVSDSAFTVTYTTTASVIGTLALLSSTDKPQVILDERDEQSGVPKPYTVHSISAKNLTPGATYSFKVLSGTTTYLDGDKPFSLTIPEKLSETPTEQIPLAGKILLPDGTKPTEALLFVTTDTGQLLSTLLNPAGLYIIPLNTMRTKDLTGSVKFSSSSKLQILAINQTLTSHVTVGITGINPLAPITLSQDYDFTIQTTPLATNSATVNFPILSFTNTTLQATPEIITPKKDESFTDAQPQFKGKAAPNSNVTISIHSDAPISTHVTTDDGGNWLYRPTSPLAPGQHTITVTTPDAYGILHTITQQFTVYAAGTQVNQSATPSATLTPQSPTNTPIPSQTNVIIPSPSITASTSITPVASAISSKPTPRPTLPPTGSNTIAIAGIAGVATTIIGIVLFLVTSGATL